VANGIVYDSVAGNTAEFASKESVQIKSSKYSLK